MRVADYLGAVNFIVRGSTNRIVLQNTACSGFLFTRVELMSGRDEKVRNDWSNLIQLGEILHQPGLFMNQVA